jgi:hypothetical protein
MPASDRTGAKAANCRVTACMGGRLEPISGTHDEVER